MVSIRRLAQIAAVAVLFAGSAHAAPVFSDNFNAENGGVGQLNYTGFAKWDVTTGSVDLIGNGFYDFLPGNGLYVDMDGSTGQAGALTTKQTFGPGSYTLSFDLAGSQRGPDGIVTVKLGSLDQTIDLASTVGFTKETFSLTVSGSDQLSFASQVPGNVGALLDNVTLTSGSVPVPEPASLGLLAFGALGVRLASRRRRN